MRAEDRPQLGQYPAKVGTEAGRLTGAEEHGPAAGVHHQGVVAAGLGVAAFGVPALGDRLSARIGHEVVVDEVHRVGGGAGGQHPRGERPCRPSGSQCPARAEHRARNVPSSGVATRATRAPASARRRCLAASTVPAPNAKPRVAVVSTHRSPCRRAGPPVTVAKIPWAPTRFR